MLAFKVEGMTCNHCVSAVTRAVMELDPGAEVAVDLPGGMVRIQSRATPEQISTSIGDAGYAVVSCQEK